MIFLLPKTFGCQKYLKVYEVNQPVKCPDYSSVVQLHNWYNHDYRSVSLQKCNNLNLFLSNRSSN